MKNYLNMSKFESEKMDMIIEKNIEEEVEREKNNRVEGKIYYFIDSSIYGTSSVTDGYYRTWLDDNSINSNPETNFYHHITKTKNEEYYKYFTTKGWKIHEDYKPKEFVKLVHFEDSKQLGLIIHSQFCRVELDERRNRVLNIK